MPFPWKKKTRVTRISQIVADLQSPKRGGSLVVQTGFPTSLIDLFVKNRSRFARTKPKKPDRPEIPDPPPPPPSPASSPPPPIPTVPRPEAQTRSLIRENVKGDASSDSGRVRGCIFGSGLGNRVVGVAIRVLVVVVLIASVKRLTVGITVSASALLFLEYATKRAVSCTMPCSNNVALESLAQRAFARIRFQNPLLLHNKPKEEEESELRNVQGEAEFSELRSGSSVLDEIEVVETESEESCCVIGPELGLIGSELMEEVDDDDDSSKGKVVVDASSSCEANRVRRSSFGFKSKMVKKLVPKKFRGCKKEKNREKMGKECEADSTSCEIEEEARNVGKQGELEGDFDEVDFGITGSEESSSSLVREDMQRIGRVGNSGYTVLVVIALSGLLLGRLQALILIMAWYFMLKIVRILWRSQSHDVLKF